MKKLDLENCSVAVGFLLLRGVDLEICMLTDGSPDVKYTLESMT
jgi:hypothetical protein